MLFNSDSGYPRAISEDVSVKTLPLSLYVVMIKRFYPTSDWQVWKSSSASISAEDERIITFFSGTIGPLEAIILCYLIFPLYACKHNIVVHKNAIKISSIFAK